MAAEAEATDILVRMMMEGGEYFLRISGAMAEKSLALLFAGIKTVYDHNKGVKKLGGKINTRSFINSFVSSSVFPLSKSDLDKLKPELKRLHIPYMQYKTTKEMRNDGRVEISVRREDAEKFIRVAENLGIATVTPYETKVEELTAEEYEQSLSEGSAKDITVGVSESGITVSENENPTQAPTDDLSNLSEQNSKDYNPFEAVFNPEKGIGPNLENAQIVAARRNGQLIPISADKDSLFISADNDSVILTVPGTKKGERLVVPKKDIVSMDANGGKAVTADLKANEQYDILDKNNKPLRNATGADINASGKWHNSYAPRKKTQKAPIPIPTKGGGK